MIDDEFPHFAAKRYLIQYDISELGREKSSYYLGYILKKLKA
jgi:hypothetical protein